MGKMFQLTSDDDVTRKKNVGRCHRLLRRCETWTKVAPKQIDQIPGPEPVWVPNGSVTGIFEFTVSLRVLNVCTLGRCWLRLVLFVL